jgi:phosphoadenosine phosphosulfate reductase
MNPLPARRERPAADLAALVRATAHLSGHTLLAQYLTRELPGEIAVVSSFGAESAVLLAMVADINPATPVLFLDTGRLFGETLRYRDRLARHLGLTNVLSLPPDPSVEDADPDLMLWQSDADRCCDLRKVRPLARALQPFAGWVNGRKRYQASTREAVSTVELDGDRIKLSPLALWSEAEIEAAMAGRNLPRHPLVEDGFRSIGCMPCTDRVAAGEDARAGRWRGQQKIECGLHRPAHLLTSFAAGGTKTIETMS